jgi:enterochelin esterase-like enzyme
MVSFGLLLIAMIFSCMEVKRPPLNIVLPPGYVNRYYQGMRYGLFVPPDYDAKRSYPLVVYLHGSKDTTSWDLRWYHEPFLSTDPCIVVTPKSLNKSMGWGSSWHPKPSKDLKETFEIIALVRQEFNVDPKRIYVHGTSMGGFGAIAALSLAPDLFAAGFSVCGGGDAQNIHNLINKPLWLFHGSQDDVVPVEQSRALYQALKAAGSQVVRYTEYPGVKHTAWEPVGKEPTLYPWLLAQRLDARYGAPDSVVNWELHQVAERKVELSWQLPDPQTKPENRIWYSRIYRNGEIIKEVDNVYTSSVDSLPGAGNYHYSITLVNYYFKESPSATKTITVP